ncbi:MAG: AMP phosphorylase [Candidatus Micrarchaeia archaeon]
MIFKVRNLDIETGASVAMLNEYDANGMGLHASDRIEIKIRRNRAIAIVNIANFMKSKSIGLTAELRNELEAKDNDDAEVNIAVQPKSLVAIKEKLNGRRLDYQGAYEIIRDTVNGKLDREELTAFVVALHAHGIDIEEATYISNAMVNTGEELKLKKKRIYDKHSIGGVPGDKTTLLVVPIVAAAGLTIPKTSSRAITSAAGTADRAEVLMPVNLGISEMKSTIEKTNGCIVWGGAVHLAPADDMLIKIEYPFSIDPLLLPSIMSKKKAVGSTDLVLDIPIGETVKVKNKTEAEMLVRDFSSLGERLNINVNGAITYGEQPVGYAIGAAAEAREALATITRKKIAEDLVDKATSIAGILLEMSGNANGKKLARDILLNGSAEKKLREIIAEQGGDENIKTDDIEIGSNSITIHSEFDGKVMQFDNIALAYAARLAGAPGNKKAAVILHKKLGDAVAKGEALMTIYSDSVAKAKDAESYAKSNGAIIVGKGNMMLIKRVIEKKLTPLRFTLER